jgi:hypothetical protein
MSRLSLPEREGPRPETGPEVPHVQFTQKSPVWIREELTQWLGSAFPRTKTGPSEISTSTNALFLDGVEPATGSVLLPPRLTAEFAHVHADGSLHLALSTEDQDELVGKGWGERHPLYSPQVNVVMLYGPRDPDELHVARTVSQAAYRYAIGEHRASE